MCPWWPVCAFIGNLAYATRLGLWGTHSPFYSFKEFKESMETRGLGALEMLAMELKAKVRVFLRPPLQS